MLCSAWDEPSPELIFKAYNKLKIHSDKNQPNSAESMVEMLQHVQQVENKDFLAQSRQKAPDQETDVGQILRTITRHNNENESNNVEDDGLKEKQVSYSEAAECFKKCSLSYEEEIWFLHWSL